MEGGLVEMLHVPNTPHVDRVPVLAVAEQDLWGSVPSSDDARRVCLRTSLVSTGDV
jgi:hypothetical protein